MDAQMISNEIKAIPNRDKMVRFLDGYSADRMEELDERKTKFPLVKSYMLETVGDDGRRKDIAAILNNSGIQAEQIDDNLHRVSVRGTDEYMGFIETLDNPRYSVFYTLHKSDMSDRWVKNLVSATSDLDHVWLSGWTFKMLWEQVAKINNPNRYGRITFLHESIFEVDSEPAGSDDDSDETDEAIMESDEIIIKERRTSKFSMVDKISVIVSKLEKLQEDYAPLHAINQLRFPSPMGRGGHDFYDNGKVTNRSSNFRDHRSHILYVQSIYDAMMQDTEAKAWYSLQKETVPDMSGGFQKLIGSPVYIKFTNELPKPTFDYWIHSTFGRANNKFRLWGNPIRFGPLKVHVYGVDKHLWQPLYLEITSKHLLAIVPKGTCGNTIQRLVTNIQRYIDPAAVVTIGNEQYSSMANNSAKGVDYGKYK